MIVTSKQIMYLCGGNSKYTDYKVLSSMKVTKTVRHKIPKDSSRRDNKGGLPDYLKGFEDYYDEWRWCDGRYRYYTIKREYIDKALRPEYEIEVTYELLDIELTEKGKKECERRLNIHKKNMERYALLLGRRL